MSLLPRLNLAKARALRTTVRTLILRYRIQRALIADVMQEPRELSFELRRALFKVSAHSGSPPGLIIVQGGLVRTGRIGEKRAA
jgi:hypothetical protein